MFGKLKKKKIEIPEKQLLFVLLLCLCSCCLQVYHFTVVPLLISMGLATEKTVVRVLKALFVGSKKLHKLYISKKRQNTCTISYKEIGLSSPSSAA